MNNILLEMKKILSENKNQLASPEMVRVRLKEYLQYFVLDFIYNSPYRHFVFYGGTCLRILSELERNSLGRMSEDLDFEVLNTTNFKEFCKDLENYFRKNLLLKSTKISVPKKTNSVYNIVATFPVMAEIGFSKHVEETLKIRIDLKPVSPEYFRAGTIIFTPISKDNSVFMLRHYDFPTLMATKIAAILQRDKRGFYKGQPDEQVNFKGRDFYDLIWYMQKRIIPNMKTLKAEGIDQPLEKTFHEIAEKIEKIKLDGIKKDLTNLFAHQMYIESWVENFKETFYRLKNFYNDPT